MEEMFPIEEFDIIEDVGDVDNNLKICELLATFAQNTYYVDKENKPNHHLDAVIALMEKDYKVVKISNSSGNKCFNYPMVIPIMESDRHVTTIYEDEENGTFPLKVNELEDLFENAKLARCRQRFPVPVILFRGQYICRSSTVASVPEVCYRGGFANCSGMDILMAIKEFLWPNEESSPEVAPPDAENTESHVPSCCEKIRNEDVNLLKALNVKNIVNIMVEKRKVKLAMYVSASETVDAERYSCFQLLTMPYPGCEFFTKFHDNLYNSDGLVYDWNHPSNDAELSIPDDKVSKSLNISWDQYKNWDLTLLTQNYMKYIIKRLQEDNAGLLLHCISGWDRTPLFISLIRLTLWADGLVHESLDEYDIIYFTLAYDWYLFGHHLNNRLAKNEEIMVFCFDFLKNIRGDEYSAKPPRKRRSDESRSPAPSNGSSTGNLHDDDLDDVKKDLDKMEVMSQSSYARVVSLLADASNDVMATNNDAMEVFSEPTDKHISKNNRLSPNDARGRRTSPVLMKSPTKRVRTSSTSSWQSVNDCGSVEQESNMKSIRSNKLGTARKIFLSCYQKTVKKESYGPSKSVIEDVVLYLSSLIERTTSAGSEPNPMDESSNNDQNNDK